jgi:hypothetical protein
LIQEDNGFGKDGNETTVANNISNTLKKIKLPPPDDFRSLKYVVFSGVEARSCEW